MKSNYHSILFTTASLALGVGTASAANKYWSGTGNWSDSTWSTVSGGPYTTTWATYDEANFEGTAGTVTVTGTQTANRIFFTTNGYTLTGGTLGFGGPGGQGTVSVASGITGIIQSNINTGNDGIRKFGSGTLTLTGSTITNSAFTVLSGGTLAYEGVGTWSQNNDSYLGNSAGTGLSKLNLSSGTFSAAGRTICVGVRDSAELNISGPTTLVTAATITSLWQGDASAGCSATLNLDGGTLTTNAISRNSTIRNFTANLNGGLLKAGAAGTLLNANLSRVNVRDGGAKIDTNGFDPTVAAALQHSNVSGDNATDGGLTKTGNGTLTLSGANTYTGGTTINGGTLKLTGSVTSPLIVVGASGTLEGGTFGSGNTVSGTGTLTETVTIGAGATLAPAGDGSIGNLAVNGTLTLAGNTSIDVNKSGLTITSDHISGTGTVTAGGTLTLHTTGDPLVVGDVIQILDGVAVTSGSAFASVTVVPTLPAGTSIDTSNLAVNGTVQVVNRLASPSFSPASGGYVGAQSVTISSDSGTTIYYTVDGSDPTNSPTNGPSPVTLTVPTETYQYTVKAIAKKSGQGNSLVATAVYNTVTTPTWIANVDGHWSNAITYPEDKANWKNDVIAGGVGIAADFGTLELSQNITVTLDDSRCFTRTIIRLIPIWWK